MEYNYHYLNHINHEIILQLFNTVDERMYNIISASFGCLYTTKIYIQQNTTRELQTSAQYIKCSSKNVDTNSVILWNISNKETDLPVGS